ncbi:hypothetical protein DPMN_133914 [Dreissena polymorpha]|uniref:Uncharacterized protein n=1 Tax=Dreissena polymorpha TaxID=45954 RepID=A0A9D4JF64_DREPO|nr:hypothetical protein DPMN_133795 [Dreissena polymorpha]KAH3805609.1 hypothetical protein DPMN_133914 [Dreissena polymorpha]
MDDVQHVSVAARKILLRKVDMEMRKAGLIRDHPRTIKRIMLSDKVENYKILDKTVSLICVFSPEKCMYNFLLCMPFTKGLITVPYNMFIFFTGHRESLAGQGSGDAEAGRKPS